MAPTEGRRYDGQQKTRDLRGGPGGDRGEWVLSRRAYVTSRLPREGALIATMTVVSGRIRGRVLRGDPVIGSSPSRRRAATSPL